MTRDDTWGMCSANGCPLFGSVSSSTTGDHRWLCFCHFAVDGRQDPITLALNSDACKPLVIASKDIRQCYGTSDWPEVYRGIQRTLIAAERRDLLLGLHDESPHWPGAPIVREWLARIERHLLSATRSAGKQQKLAPPTAPVLGPTHVSGYIAQIEESA